MNKFKFLNKKEISRLPKEPGVYCFKKSQEVLLNRNLKNSYSKERGRERKILSRVGKQGTSRASERQKPRVSVENSPVYPVRKSKTFQSSNRENHRFSNGVYLSPEGRGAILYIGKAVNIRERVKNHFQRPGFREKFFWDESQKIGYIKTGSEVEALILEAQLIKKYQPKYNVVWRDDKNFFYVAITKEDFPRVFITHQPAQLFARQKLRRASPKMSIVNGQMSNVHYIGPFVDGKSLKLTLKSLRKVFPFRTCKTLPKKPCLWYQLKRCPAPCLLKSPKESLPEGKQVSYGAGRLPTGQAKLGSQIPGLRKKMAKECQKNVKNLIKILQGKKKQVLSNLKKEMKSAAQKQEFERAGKIRDQITALEYVLSHSQIFPFYSDSPVGRSNTKKVLEGLKKILGIKKIPKRIEAYDVSNIQGQLATGSMVTFIEGKPDKNFYRRFKIKYAKMPMRIRKPNDIAMLKEVLSRRLKHKEWPYPDLILIDGGIAQLNAALKIKKKIKVVSLAKKGNKLYVEGKKEPILLKDLSREISNLILEIRDEAHRFAIKYHKKLRKKGLLG